MLGCVLMLYNVSCLLLSGWGSTSQWWGGGVGGSFLVFLMVSLGGFPAWDHFGKLGLGTGCFGLADA